MFPALPAHAQPVILRIWQNAHVMMSPHNCPLFVQFEVTAYNVLMFAATQHQIMPFKSRTSDVRVAKDDDRAGYGKINVNDADDDIHIQLPRKVPEPNVTDIAPLCPWVSKYVTMVFTKFDVRQSNSSVDMWLKVPRSNTKYLVQWGMEQPPNITNGIWEYSELVDVDGKDSPVNIMRSTHNCHHFADNIFTVHFFYKSVAFWFTFNKIWS